MQDDDYDDGGMELPDDDLSDSVEMTDLEAGGVVMADLDQDLVDDIDSEPSAEGRARGGTAVRPPSRGEASAGRQRAAPRRAGAKKVAKKAAKKAGRKAGKKRAKRKAAGKAAAKKTARRRGKKGARKARRKK